MYGYISILISSDFFHIAPGDGTGVGAEAEAGDAIAGGDPRERP